MDKDLVERTQKFSVGEIVTLYDILISGTDEVYHFCPSAEANAPVSLDGVEYLPVPVEFEGLEISSVSLPRPKVRLPAINGLVASLTRNYDDLLGSIIVRRRTLSRYLDGHEGEGISAEFPREMYIIERKTLHTSEIIEWELRSVLDLEGVKLPRRQILQNFCTRIYRKWDPDLNEFKYTIWNNSAFSIDELICPYTGSDYFDIDGNAVDDPSLDKCGKRVYDCKKRFPNDPLPIWAFPGVARMRT
ncbi:MAG: phage minor tail protein L [Candidatus Methanomethylicaceae archaeon]